jgi:hypothetical protein
MPFIGFTLLQNSGMPPELLELLPEIDSLAELKVTLCLLDAHSRAGPHAAPLTFDQLKTRTGLSHEGTHYGAQRALAHGLIRRWRIGSAFAYAPVCRSHAPDGQEPWTGCEKPKSESPDAGSVGKNLDSGTSKPERTCESLESGHSCMHDTLHPDITEKTSHYVNNHADESEIQTRLLRALTEEFGISARVATNLVATYDPAHIQVHLEHARYARTAGLIQRNRAGWLVASIRDNWPPPVGYADAATAAATPTRRWYTDEEYEQFFFHPE